MFKFRIICKGKNSWKVQYKNPDIARWLSVQNFGISRSDRYFNNQTDCEVYIKKHIKSIEEQKIQKEETEKFIAAHPPREVPPFTLI